MKRKISFRDVNGNCQLFNENGNMIYNKDMDFEQWWEFNEKGNQIHYRNSRGYEEWAGYNNKGNKNHYKTSRGFEEWFEYDDNNYQIYYKRCIGIICEDEWHRKYNEKGKCIYEKNKDNIEYYQEFNDNGRLISYKDNNNRNEKWEYDDNDNLINFCRYYGDRKVSEIKNQYDERGNKIYSINNGVEEWIEYADNKIIHFRNSEGYEYWNDYVEV